MRDRQAACGSPGGRPQRKFAGSAQRRLKHHFLIHVSILYNFPLPLISRYLGTPRRLPDYRAGRSHEEFVTNLGLPRDRLLGALRSAWLSAQNKIAGSDHRCRQSVAFATN